MSSRSERRQQEEADRRVEEAIGELEGDQATRFAADDTQEPEEVAEPAGQNSPDGDPVADQELSIDVSHNAEMFSEQLVKLHADKAEVLAAYAIGISEIPSWISQFTRLKDLDLSENFIGSTPSELGQISTLERLALDGNRIHELDENLFKLRNLKNLQVSSNAIDYLPDAIQALDRLEELNLRANRITLVSDNIGKLTSLEILDLSANNIKQLPNAIGSLTNLQVLSVSDNKLRTLPPTIRWLSNLEVLDLSQNFISTLPSQIGQITGLTSLDLSENRLKRLPHEIGKLTQLEHLDLSENELVELPRELGHLPDSVNINLDGNPLAEPLPTLLKRGTSALLTYLRSLDDGKPQYEAKVLLVGEGGVGKSSLLAALRDEKFVSNRPTTHGIEVDQLQITHPQLKKNQLKLNTWDFGGQEVYRTTHQFFFTRRALYLVVWKPREGQEENNVESWCKRVRLRVSDHARIIVVATHADERRPEFDFKHLQSRYPNLLVDYCLVDSESGKGIKELREAIAREAAKLPQMGEIISQSWLRARDEILSQTEPQITRLSLERICSRHGLDEAEAETLSALLHDLGHLIHYGDDDALREIVVLQPEWITKAIGYVLEDEETRTYGGVLQHSKLNDIWLRTDGDTHYEPRMYPYFLRLMEKFDVSYRLASEEQSLVAQLVPYERPDSIWQDRALSTVGRRGLHVICRLAEEAPGLISWLTVRNHRFTVGKHWRRGVLLSHRTYASEAVFELYANNFDLSLTVIGPSPDYFFHVLKDGLEELIQIRWQGQRYEFLVPCPHSENGVPCPGMISYNALRKFRERGRPQIPCNTCANWCDVTEMLTGFGRYTAPIDTLIREIQTLSTKVDVIQAKSADMAQQMRIIIRVLSTEVKDCPRLFTLVPTNRSAMTRALSPKDRFTLTLWCEEPGQEHEHADAQYDFLPPKAWLQAVSPYLKVVVGILKFAVPIATAAYGAAITDEQLKTAKADLDLMKTLSEKIPESEFSTEKLQRGMTKAQGAGLRALRTLLATLDTNSNFGDLRRVTTPSGDLIWVCPEHYLQYDPGLPKL